MFGRRTGNGLPGHSSPRAARDAPAGAPDPYAAAREEMIEDQLRRRGVVMHSVLEAMREIPRHLFMTHGYANRAYDDEALPSLEGQTISQPFMVAIMTQELALRPGLRVLEIGTGTGYQTAILAHLVGPEGEVFTIERFAALTDFARKRLEALEIRNVRYLVGDGSAGWPEGSGPVPKFERILITAGTPEVPPPLLAQLADGGILIAPVGASDSQILVRVVRHGESFRQAELLACRFVPLVGAHAWDWEEYRRTRRER
jgi:protein-L-isoaspartate(D-aspartate) O-methyltransferase